MENNKETLDFKTVEQRIKQFYTKYPKGNIKTEITHFSDPMVIVKASIFDDNMRLLATGHAGEVY